METAEFLKSPVLARDYAFEYEGADR